MGNLAVIENFNVPMVGVEMKEAIAEELEGLEQSFDRIKIPTGGNIAFEVPGEGEESEIVKEIIGVIVDQHSVNARWENKYDGGNKAPDCSSMDGKIGNGVPGGDCKSCMYNRFGSDGSTGKACKNMHRVYILQEGEAFPLLLTLPPTSIRNFSNYIGKRVVFKGQRSYGVVTKITLKRAQNSTGIAYSQVQFSKVGKLNDKMTEIMKNYSEDIKKITRKINIINEDYDSNNLEQDDIPF